MLEEAKVQEIRRLLRYSPYSQREIARQAGVSRGSVAAIAGGRYRPASGDAAKLSVAREEPLSAERCRDCGALVYPPCRACTLRSRAESLSR